MTGIRSHTKHSPAPAHSADRPTADQQGVTALSRNLGGDAKIDRPEVAATAGIAPCRPGHVRGQQGQRPLRDGEVTAHSSHAPAQSSRELHCRPPRLRSREDARVGQRRHAHCHQIKFRHRHRRVRTRRRGRRCERRRDQASAVAPRPLRGGLRRNQGTPATSRSRSTRATWPALPGPTTGTPYPARTSSRPTPTPPTPVPLQAATAASTSARGAPDHEPGTSTNATRGTASTSKPASPSNCSRVSNDGAFRPFSYADDDGRDICARRASSPCVRPTARRAHSISAHAQPQAHTSRAMYPIGYSPRERCPA